MIVNEIVSGAILLCIGSVTRYAARMNGETEENAFRKGLMNDRLSFRLRRLLTLLGSRVTDAFGPFKLRSGSFTTMALIAANPGCSQVDLAREGGLDPSVLVSIVDELEKRSLAKRSRSTVDRRRSSLYLTPEGETLMREMYDVAMGTEEAIRQSFTTDEMDQFSNYLDRALQALQRDAS